MSFGHSGTLRFEVNKNSAGPGIFWQKDKPKTDQRKFGYKSKNLRHPIRRPDNAEALEELQIAQEEERRKYNRNNVDFIRKNQQRFKQKSDGHDSSNGSTHIGPGTVTLTQDQLAALLASLGGLKNTGDKDSPLRISIDASNNKIEVEKYESDSGNGDDVEDDNHDGDEEGGGPGIGIYDLLDDGEIVKKPTKPKKKHRDTDLNLSREKDRKDAGKNEAEKYQNDPGPDTARSTLNDAKREAKIDHISPTVPWKHMTVGERKRMQWAMERAELQQEYDPWGRPGAGAPMGKQEATKPPEETVSQERLLRQRQKEDLQNEIQKLQKEIQEAEQMKQMEEKRRQKKVEEKPKSKQRSRQDSKDQKPVEETADVENARRKKRGHREASESRRADIEKEEKMNTDQVQIIIVNKKKDRQKEKEGEVERKTDGEDEGEGDDLGRKSNDGNTLIESSQIAAEVNGSAQSSKEDLKEKGSRPEGQATDKKKKSEGLQFGAEDDLSHLTKKEMERRKWLAELDKQREEQRMKKQQEKERDRAGVQDQWADRFVYHKSPQLVTPRYGQSGLGHQGQESVLGKAPEDSAVSHAPPAAMRSSMVIGAGTLNENRYDNKKAEEKRQWLEELEKQREAQRQARADKKDRERREDDGMWADRFQTDRQKLNQFAGTSSQGPSFNDYPQAPEQPATQRISSAPEQPLTVRDSQEEPTTFIRGQGVYVDPVTRKEQEEKRRVHLEYQAQIKAQIEEKERLKREERERKAREDMEEEKKLQMERERFQRQEESEQKKIREREALRQKQIAVLKTAMDEAQEKAQEEKNVRRMQHLRQGGHDVTQLKATYEEPVSRMSGPGTHRFPDNDNQSQAATPRVKDYDISNIPGLGNTASSPIPQVSHHNYHVPDQPMGQVDAPVARGPNHHQVRGRHPIGQSYTKDPYVEDRVLTPSRFRNPSKPMDDPDSPRREFGTQTLELKDLQAILNSLPDDIQIEYKMKVEEALKEKEKSKPAPNRKVHSKSAEDARRTRKTVPRKEIPKEKPAVREKPPKVNERPAWNQPKRKTVIKNSERDPFYQQRREEAEERKNKRERQLAYLQELNKERIPSLSPTRARANSPENGRKKAERGRKPADSNKTRKPARGESPNILSLLNDGKTDRTRSKSPTGRNRSRNRSSPPLPTVKHRTVAREEDPNNPYSYTNSVLRSSQTETKYGDASVATAPVHDGDFVPFMRTMEILDPAQADAPLAISRENSRMERARKAYHETRQPANKGKRLDVYQDREREAALKAAQDPILNPQLVTEHPTARQDMILQQLSSLKQNLMQRRQELENYMSPSELQAD